LKALKRKAKGGDVVFKIEYGLFLFLMALLTPSCEKGVFYTSSPSSEINDLVVVETKGGQKRWEMKAERASIEGDGELVVVKGLRMTFLMEDTPVSEIRAETANIRRMGKEVEMGGKVWIKSSDGFLLTAKKLLLDVERDTVSIPGEIQIVKGGSRIKGYDLSSDTGLRYIRLSNVSGSIEKSEIRR
jgi:LPS export ABC transporter protein LptC